MFALAVTVPIYLVVAAIVTMLGVFSWNMEKDFRGTYLYEENKAAWSMKMFKYGWVWPLLSLDFIRETLSDMEGTRK